MIVAHLLDSFLEIFYKSQVSLASPFSVYCYNKGIQIKEELE